MTESQQGDAWTVVVGGAGAIGERVVSRLVADGHRVLVIGRNQARLASLRDAVPNVASILAADVTDPQVAELINRTIARSGIRLLVHMPAAPTGGGILDASGPVILDAVAVKVVGLLQMVIGLRSRFVRDASVVAVGGNLAYDPIPDAATSGIANAALANAVKQLQRALGGEGIRFFTIAPGPVETERWRSLVESEARRRGIPAEEVAAQAMAGSPLGRLTSADEVAWAITRLAEPEAGALAGSTLMLDTGRRTSFP